MIRICILLLVFAVQVLVHPGPALAQTTYVISPKQSLIQGSIRYSVIGKYVAHFEEFQGAIYFDTPGSPKSSVNLDITTQSIKSNFLSLDRIVVSGLLLNAAKFPHITFHSDSLEHIKGNEYKVKGKATLHGVTRELEFPFLITEWGTTLAGQEYLRAEGKWLIRRKDFGITWNKLLDQGGVLVGDHITLDWSIVAIVPGK